MLYYTVNKSSIDQINKQNNNVLKLTLHIPHPPLPKKYSLCPNLSVLLSSFVCLKKSVSFYV